MEAPSVDGRSLRELMKDMEVVCREFADHLLRGFSPRIDEFARAIQIGQSEPITVRSARHSLQPTLESHSYSRDVYQRFQQLISAIDARSREILNVG